MSETAGSDAVDPANDGITVALIEDNRLVREGIASLLNQFPDIQVVTSQGGDHESLLLDANPRVVLLDLGLEGDESVELARKVGEDFPDAGIIVMDLLPAHEEIVELISAGVSAFVMKDATLEDLVSTIRAVAAGEEVLPAQMTASLFSQIARDEFRNSGPEVPDSVRMTPREREVINLIAEGLSNKAISNRLHISSHTVKSHLRNIMEKLTLHSRLEIAAYVHQRDAGP